MKKAVAAVIGAFSVVALAGSAFSADITYRQHVKPIMDAQCVMCHGEKNPEHDAFGEEKKKWMSENQGMRMDTYSHLITYIGWPYTGAFMRRLDDGKALPSGKPGNMYQYLGATEAERQNNLTVMKDWVGVWNLKRGKEITKDEIFSLKLKY